MANGPSSLSNGSFGKTAYKIGKQFKNFRFDDTETGTHRSRGHRIQFDLRTVQSP